MVVPAYFAIGGVEPIAFRCVQVAGMVVDLYGFGDQMRVPKGDIKGILSDEILVYRIQIANRVGSGHRHKIFRRILIVDQVIVVVVIAIV